MDDFHTGNIIVDGDELMGFIDLEMTRYGYA
jgi:aminoglycoside phosphotransferase (APT) family kinase protein